MLSRNENDVKSRLLLFIIAFRNVSDHMGKTKNNSTAFGRNLQHLRKMRGETLAEAGEELLLSPTRLKNYENGDREPDFSILSQISQHYGKQWMSYFIVI